MTTEHEIVDRLPPEAAEIWPAYLEARCSDSPSRWHREAILAGQIIKALIQSLPLPASCDRCKGTGVVRERSDPDNAAIATYPCPKCKDTDAQVRPLPAESTAEPKITVELPEGDGRKVKSWFKHKTEDGWNVCVEVSDGTATAELCELAVRMDERCFHHANCGVYFDTSCNCGYSALESDFAAYCREHPDLPWPKEGGDGK